MTKIKEKTLKNLKRKRFWPSIVLFLTFSISSFLIIVIGIEVFVTYVVGSKIMNQSEVAQETAYVIEQKVQYGEDIPHAVRYANFYLRNANDMYVVDEHGKCVMQVGDTKPILEQYALSVVGEAYEIYPDVSGNYSGMPISSLKDIFLLNMSDIAERALNYSEYTYYETQNEWLKEVIVEQPYWVHVPADLRGAQLYVKGVLEIERQDVIYVLYFGALAFLLLFLPLTFMFVNTILNIRTQHQMSRVLYMDPVTGGHNWLYFQQAVLKLFSKAWNRRKTYAMVDIHLVHYLNYISCYGSEKGEELLESMDSFLQARIKRTEIYAHNSRADFGLVIRCRGANEEECKAYCYKRLRSLLAELAGLQPEKKLHFHAGVCMLYPRQKERDWLVFSRKNADVEQLFNLANTAQQFNHVESEQIYFFNEKMLEQRRWEQWVENNMQSALAAGEFQVYLQPKYNPVDKKLVGAEALVRWVCPEHGMIMPGRFIPIFEANGFIRKLDDYMLAQIAKLQSEWTVERKKAVPISVNISRAHFAQAGLAEHISRLVDGYGSGHNMIELEVTESAFFDDKKVLIDTVKQLRAYGFPVSMDDFGAGYSSLNSLKDIPLDALKLDAEFFRGEDEMGRGEIIVREAISLARELRMKVVAEGIEVREQVDFLVGLGCDMIQGYYFAKPMPVSEFEQLMARDA